MEIRNHFTNQNLSQVQSERSGLKSGRSKVNSRLVNSKTGYFDAKPPFTLSHRNIQEYTDQIFCPSIGIEQKYKMLDRSTCGPWISACPGLIMNWYKALSFNFHLESDSGSNKTAEKHIPKTNIDYVRVPVIQKLAEEELPNSIECWNGYEQVDSPELSSSDEIIVV